MEKGEPKFGPIPPETPLARKAAITTLARLEKFSDLNAKTKEEGEQKFIQLTKKLWKEFAVHGIVRKNEKTGEVTLLNFTDLDGLAAIGLLNLAGIDTSDLKYVKPGEFISGRINLDTGNRYGLEIQDNGKTVFLDHHADTSDNKTSATQITYETLVSLGLLKKEKYLDELVTFVTQIDNRTFPQMEKYFKDSWRNLLGLYRFIKFPQLLKFFKDGHKPTERLKEDDLKKYGFIYKDSQGKIVNKSEEQKAIVESSLATLTELEKTGFIINSRRYGKIAIDVGKKVKAGFDAVKAFGCNAYLIWTPEKDSFFLSVDRKLVDEFPQGRKIRENMWIKPLNDGIPLKLTLKEVLNKLTSGKLMPTKSLKEFIENEEKVK